MHVQWMQFTNIKRGWHAVKKKQPIILLAVFDQMKAKIKTKMENFFVKTNLKSKEDSHLAISIRV